MLDQTYRRSLPCKGVERNLASCYLQFLSVKRHHSHALGQCLEGLYVTPGLGDVTPRISRWELWVSQFEKGLCRPCCLATL